MTERPESVEPPKVAVFLVGNKLMYDDGAAPALYEMIAARLDPAPSVRLYDVGCMTLDMLPYVEECDVLITVDAADVEGEEPGTVFRYVPDDLARIQRALPSLHDLRLADLFDTAALLGYRAQGMCFGIQVENRSPSSMAIGLTPSVRAALPRLFEALSAELAGLGVPFVDRATGRCVTGPLPEGFWEGSQG